MKKIFILVLAALFVLSGFAMAAPNYSPGTGDIFGNGTPAGESHKIFRLVRNGYVGSSVANTGGVSVDSIVIWDTISDDGRTVTLSTTSGDSRVAGVVVGGIMLSSEAGTIGNTATQQIGKRNWGWIQTYGKCEVSMDATSSVVAGYAIGCGSQPGQASGFSPLSGGATIAITHAANMGMAGFAYDDAAASGANTEVFLKGLD
jgi:hypothetical protein